MKGNITSKKILIIESHNSFREPLKELLLLRGYEVIVAQNGLEGLQIAKQKLPSLIICASKFQDIDCWELKQALKKDSLT